MGTEIIVNQTGRETRMAILEAGRLAELLIDRGDNRGFVGNVYLGRVVRVLPGMQAAFVDIGLERAAFLYVGDIYTDFLHMHEDPATSEADTSEVPRSRGSSRSNQPPIQDLLTEGQNIVVQVAKDPIGTKGARLTTHIAMPGRYVVFMPTVEHVGISRRIERDRERRRLRELVERTRPKGAGFIVRTVCEGQPELVRAQAGHGPTCIKPPGSASRRSRPPRRSALALIHADHGLVLRVVRDMLHRRRARSHGDRRQATLYDEGPLTFIK